MKFYCSTCDRDSRDETCCDCGSGCDELCEACGELVENCDCLGKNETADEHAAELDPDF